MHDISHCRVFLCYFLGLFLRFGGIIYNTMELTIYSDDYDKDEGVSNGGFSGKVFLDGVENGVDVQYADMTLSQMLSKLDDLGLDVDSILFCYRSSKGEQRFRRWKVA